MKHAILSIMCAALIAAAPATRPTRAGKADPLTAEAQAALAGKTLPAFATKVDTQLTALLTATSKLDAAQIVRLGMLREFARFAGRLKEPSEADLATLNWLLEQPDLCAALVAIVSDVDDPARVLAVLASGRAKAEKAMLAAPELAAAMCVVWDNAAQGADAPADPNRVVVLWQYFSSAPLKLDVRRMPAEALIHVVDVEASPADLQWAVERYRNVASPAQAFDDVEFVERSYERGQKTLANLLANGGTLTDAAWYAAQSGKALGVPTVACRARKVDTAAPPAWVEFLDPRQNGWNARDGRKDEHEDWPGEYVDPQTRAVSSDAELTLLGGLAASPRANRLASTFIARAFDLVPAERRIALLGKALELCPANRLAWEKLPTLVGAGAGEQQVRQAEELIRRQLSRTPTYAVSLRSRLVAALPEAQQPAAWKRLIDSAGANSLFEAMALLAEGDAYRQKNDARQALVAYGQALEADSHSGPTVIAVMNRVDPMLRDARDTQRLIAIYRQAFPRVRQRGAVPYGRTTPAYVLGEKYAALLEETGDATGAMSIRAQMEALIVPGTQRPVEGGPGR